MWVRRPIRWFQFRLRGYFVFMLAAAVALWTKREYVDPPVPFPTYSEAELEAHHDEGRVVMVHITSGWDMYSSLARRELESRSFRRELSRRNVAAFNYNVPVSLDVPPVLDHALARTTAFPSCALLFPKGPRDRDPIAVCPLGTNAAHMRAQIREQLDGPAQWP